MCSNSKGSCADFWMSDFSDTRKASYRREFSRRNTGGASLWLGTIVRLAFAHAHEKRLGAMCTEPFQRTISPILKSQLVVHKQRQKQNERKWNSEQPEQCASTETHVSLHVDDCMDNSLRWSKFRV